MRGEGEMECEGGGRDGECRRVRGEALVGSDGGRESYGGEREWCRGLERGSSPGLVVARVHTYCPCPHVLPVVRALFPASVHVRGRSFSFMGMGGSLHSWAVIFVRGHPSSFMGGPSSFVGNGRVWWWGAVG